MTYSLVASQQQCPEAEHLQFNCVEEGLYWIESDFWISGNARCLSVSCFADLLLWRVLVSVGHVDLPISPRWLSYIGSYIDCHLQSYFFF